VLSDQRYDVSLGPHLEAEVGGCGAAPGEQICQPMRALGSDRGKLRHSPIPGEAPMRGYSRDLTLNCSPEQQDAWNATSIVSMRSWCLDAAMLPGTSVRDPLVGALTPVATKGSLSCGYQAYEDTKPSETYKGLATLNEPHSKRGLLRRGLGRVALEQDDLLDRAPQSAEGNGGYFRGSVFTSIRIH
jgi:hypothetical protein